MSDVSARFVRVGDDFKALKRSYAAAGLDTSDIEDVPTELRGVLEESLILEPSQQSLDTFLPRVGQIIADLMKILKEKQSEQQRLSETRRTSVATQHSESSTRSHSLLSSPVSLESQPQPEHHTPSPQSKDPISRLQNNRALMRRASKRFSAYQTSKILSMNQSAQSSPAADSPQFIEQKRYSSGPPAVSLTPSSPLQDEVSKNLKETETERRLSASIHGDHSPTISRVSAGSPIPKTPTALRAVSSPVASTVNHTPKSLDRIYLKIGNQVKKADIRIPTTLANIKVLFTQKFGYSPIGTYPNIYIQEGPNEIAYEMENIDEVTPGSILSLEQPEVSTIICNHLDEKMDLLREELAKVKESSIAAATAAASAAASAPNTSKEVATPRTKNLVAAVSGDANAELKQEVEDLKFELGKARQLQRMTHDKLAGSLNGVLELVQDLQTTGLSPNGVLTNPYMEHSKEKVSSECESLVSRIDNLQDLIEVLKVDISKRRSRPSSDQLQHIQKEVASTQEALESLTKYMVGERKNWNARWQSELTAVLEEQEFFKEQETIVDLLGEDLGSASETFDLILKCCDELAKNAKARKYPRLPILAPTMSMHDVKGQVLEEVQSLNPDHDQRVEAIAKAEKVRNMQKQLMNSDEEE